MSFFGLMTVRQHVEAIAHERYFIACRDETIAARNATIERLQRENAKLLSDITMADNQTKAAISSRDAVRARLDVVSAELDHWRKHGQLRDPKTGRLIPRVDGKAAVMAERAGSVG